MTELKILKGKHHCGNIMEFRLVNLGEGQDWNRWVIHSICEECSEVLIQAVFLDSDMEPQPGVDFIINDELVSEKQDGKLIN